MAGRPAGYKSRLRYSDADYFNLRQGHRVATARREKPFPTIEQLKHVIARMPAGSEIERRNRALVAFTLLTGARDSAIASMSLKHVDLAAGCVRQDAREVKTKFSKTFTTYFFPVGEEIREIVADWVTYLRQSKLWGSDDPLFPASCMTIGASRQFEVAGLKREHWSGAAPIRAIFREAFEAAGVPYFNPHSLRDTLVHLGETLCKTPEDFKAWSQNLGHEGVLTTFYSHPRGALAGRAARCRPARRARGVQGHRIDPGGCGGRGPQGAEEASRQQRDAGSESSLTRAFSFGVRCATVPHMGRIGVRQLQQNAATTVERVRLGESIEVTVRGRPVAKLVPVTGTLLDQLEASGRLKRGKGDVLDLGPPLKPRRGVELPSVTLARMRAHER